MTMQSVPVVIVGGGMITQVQILPTLYHLQRQGVVGDIHVCALDSPPLKALKEDPHLNNAFPGQDFAAYPDPDKVDTEEKFPELYKEVFSSLPPESVAVIAVPDQLHYPMIKDAIEHRLHICTVKPLVLSYRHAEEIADLAYRKGLVVGVEYHKRFDDRNLMARQLYREGRFGEFRLGQACMHEPYHYRHSNFQNWCTCENSDMFTYVGCHYVDLVAFITGLKPVAVSVYGIKEDYPNGNTGFLWTDGRVIWENGACLSVANAMGYPDAAAGGNAQGLTMWCQGDNDACLLVHDDQFRGVKYGYNECGTDPGDTLYAEPSPDYFKLVNRGGPGLDPVGYGFRSIEYIVKACLKTGSLKDLQEKQRLLRQYDAVGIMATPKNSSYNELVIEAGRKSILSGGRASMHRLPGVSSYG